MNCLVSAIDSLHVHEFVEGEQYVAEVAECGFLGIRGPGESVRCSLPVQEGNRVGSLRFGGMPGERKHVGIFDSSTRASRGQLPRERAGILADIRAVHNEKRL